MNQPPVYLEPAERDPKKLRRTAFILVGLMIVGGVAILTAYNRWSAAKVQDDRPAFIARLTGERDLPVVRQDGSRAGIYELRGKVNIIQVVSASQPETAKPSSEVMQRLAKHYAGNPDFVLVTLVLDPGPAEEAKNAVSTAAERLGATLPQWWVGTNLPELLHKYVKKELQANEFPHLQDGVWKYDTSLVVVDKNRHIRRGVVHQHRGGPPFVATFDFDLAAKWDARGVKTGTDLTNSQQLETLLIQTIDALLAEPYQP
ncbi:MAG: hypothetical protein QM627_04255 [Luteolibacter sp.]